jgi:hypothetical protein
MVRVITLPGGGADSARAACNAASSNGTTQQLSAGWMCSTAETPSSTMFSGTSQGRDDGFERGVIPVLQEV